MNDVRLVPGRHGYYELRFNEIGPDGRCRSRTRSTRTQDRHLAEQVLQTWLAEKSRSAAPRTVGELIDCYIEGYVTPNGVGQTQVFSLEQVRRRLGETPLRGLGAYCVRRYRHERSRQVRDATIRRELGALKAALQWGVRSGMLCPEVIIPHMDLPRASPPREVYLCAEEEQRMWTLASGLALNSGVMFSRRRAGYFICLALETAARTQAIEGLSWDRVDMDRGVIDFRDPGQKISRKRRVAVPVSDRLRPVLEHLHACSLSRHVLGHPGSTRSAFESFVARHGFQCTRHDLRRTWATLRAQRGVPLFDIAGVLGDNADTVARHYAHHCPDHLRAAVNA